MSIGKLEKVPLRDLWKHEERGFSAWLRDNLETLAEVLGMRLSDPQAEVQVGPFQADLIAEDENGTRVVIENQLEATDHEHLGKLVTYLTNLDAKTAIWISKSARPEHVNAVTWLNETTAQDVSFYLVQLEAYRIGDSSPAPLFTVIVAPSPESKAFGDQKKELAERHILRHRFWEGLLARAKERGLALHSARSPSREMWISAGSGRSGIIFSYVIWMQEDSAVELYIDTGDRDENKAVFDALAAKKGEIERAFGGPLSWERLDDKRAARIRHILKNGGLQTPEAEWPKLQDSMVDAMARLWKALKSHLSAMRGEGAA